MLTKHRAALKAHRFALLFLFALALMGGRLWYLAVICHEEFKERAQRPQFRSESIPAERGQITDRFGIPLADNQLCFELTIRFGDIQHASIGELAASGARQRTTEKLKSRAQYIKVLSEEISTHCSLPAQQVHDLIYAKATLTPSVSVCIARDLPYASFAALKLRCTRWPGMSVRTSWRRIYPMGRVGSHILGHLGQVDARQLAKIAREIRSVQCLLEIEEQWADQKMLKARLEDLQSTYQRRSDRVGQAGLEGQLDPHLRGRCGRIRVEVDARGRSLRRLARATINSEKGRSFSLAISGELQSFAEALLVQSEEMRERALLRQNSAAPFIKGGAIIALDPTTGEVVALASTPTFDPNDFDGRGWLTARGGIGQWMELPRYLGAIWDGFVPLQKQGADVDLHLTTQEDPLTWSRYLELIDSGRDRVHALLREVHTFGDAYLLVRAFEQLHAAYRASGTEENPLPLIDALYSGSGHHPTRSSAIGAREQAQIFLEDSQLRPARQICDHFFKDISRNEQKLLVVDLVRLLVDCEKVPPVLARCTLSLETYRQHACAFFRIESRARTALRAWFSQGPFQTWKRDQQRYFIAARRLEERHRRRSARPQDEYLNEELQRQFAAFWRDEAPQILHQLVSTSEADAIKIAAEGDPLKTLAVLGEADFGGDVRQLRSAIQTLASECGARPLPITQAYFGTFRRFVDLQRPLLGRYPALMNRGVQTERELAGAFRPRGGFGYLRSNGWRGATAQGSIFKLVIAYEALRRRWSPGCHFEQLNPLTMWDFVRRQNGRTVVGATREGAPIAQVYKGGRLPKSSRHEIGKIDLIDAITSSSNPYFSLLAAEEMPLDDLRSAIEELGFGRLTGIDLPGEVAGNVPQDLHCNRTGLYNTAIGQHALTVTPMQTARMLAALANGGQLITPKIVRGDEGVSIKRGLFLPAEVRRALFEGMHRVAYDAKGCASVSAIRTFAPQSSAMRAYRQLRGQFIGKTSTAEIDEWCSIIDQKPERCSHIWFGGIAFASEEKKWTRPELVVVVFLRHGTFGKEAAPLAAQLVTKWREIKGARVSSSSTV